MRAKKLLRTDPPRLTWRCTSRINRNGRRRVRGHPALAMSRLYRLQQNGERSLAMAAADSSLRISSWVMSIAVAKLRSMALIVCVGTALAAATEPRAANRDALRQIVEEQCVVHWLKKKARRRAQASTYLIPSATALATPFLPTSREARISC